MTTYSQLVDLIVRETRRPDLLPEVCSYLDQTIREVHFTSDTNKAIMYRDNLVEDQLTANTDFGFGWNIPDVARWQAMQTVRYESVVDRLTYQPTYPPEKTPGRGLIGLSAYFYRAGTRYSFAGYGATNSLISLAYYLYPRQLKYYVPGARPAEYDSDMGWTYAAAFAGTPELNLAAQNYVSNWLLLRWDTVLTEGLRAKIYKRISDTDRAKLCYSLYLSLRAGLASSEGADLAGYV